ncbi:hypothetical protein [Treponema endosymbiont of Eucomonympha sp.]|uniref:hypothetical protein n=2 Tax=Treponema endosymbiont of Eucomonympha sp. TaxID=1580831 RepID=UPI001396AC98|nr:hypothetical protein [Treponema endosymbiont of Eucomonympha sp.]
MFDPTKLLYKAEITNTITKNGYIHFNLVKITEVGEGKGTNIHTVYISVPVYYADEVSVTAQALNGEQSERGTTQIAINLDKAVFAPTPFFEVFYSPSGSPLEKTTKSLVGSQLVAQIENRVEETATVRVSDDTLKPGYGFYGKETVSIDGFIPAVRGIEVEAVDGTPGKIGTTQIKVSLVSGYDGNSPEITIEGISGYPDASGKTFSITNKGSADQSVISITTNPANPAANGYFVPSKISVAQFISAVAISPASYDRADSTDLMGFEVRNKDDKAVAYVFGTKNPEMIAVLTEAPSMIIGGDTFATEFVSLDKTQLEALAVTLNALDASYKTRIDAAIAQYGGVDANFSRANIISFDPRESVVGATFKFGTNGNKSPNGYDLKDIVVVEKELGGHTL